MRTNKLSGYFLVLLCLVSVLHLAGCAANNAANNPPYPYRVDLSLPYAPLMNQEVELTCTLYSVGYCPKVDARLLLSDGMVALDGDQIYSGEIESGQRLPITKKIVFHKTGHYKILVYTEFMQTDNYTSHFMGRFALTIGEFSSTLGTQSWPWVPNLPPPPRIYPDGQVEQ
ncbi:MAG: hypothetical protein PHO26_00075 [Dehalococcoidia bacterium]|nr:hypothetical protein [Dehalococcoidia bacterium]MDD5493834.1 hypothetical protein [Dehalococcoidia bacterium]